MKRFLWMFSALALLAALTGCDDNDEDRSVPVPPVVKGAFDEMFPGATRVVWSDRNSYLVADFTNAGVSTQAWFASDGNWRMTDVDLTYAQLPEAVKQSFESGDYASWRVDDVDKLLREGLETAYVLEVEKGEAEYDLLYSEDGVLLRAQADVDEEDDNDDMLPSALPAAVTDFLQQCYPGMRIVDVELEKGRIEVEIIDGRTPREVLFSTNGAWISTQTEVRQGDVPTVVLDALRGSQYASWTIEEIDHFTAPDDEWYLFELEEQHSDREFVLRIGADGTIA